MYEEGPTRQPYTNLHGPHQIPISYIIYVWVWNLISHIVLCQKEGKNILIFDIHDQIITYVFAPNDTHILHIWTWILNHIKIFNQLKKKTQLKIKFILD